MIAEDKDDERAGEMSLFFTFRENDYNLINPRWLGASPGYDPRTNLLLTILPKKGNISLANILPTFN